MNKSIPIQSTVYMRATQIIVAFAGLAYLLSGVALLFAPVWFFQVVGYFPPFNRHYEGDLGSFLLPLGIGLLAIARTPAKGIWVIRVAALGSLLHSVNHIYDAVIYAAPARDWLFQIVPLLVLALLLTAVSWNGREPESQK